MLTESFLFSSSSTPASSSTNNALLKDAGIFLHTHQPSPHLINTFKKSSTSPNCLAYSSTHIFAAQTTSSTLHIYNIEKGNQEATVPFRARIHSIVLCCNESVLALGTDSGAIILWEIQTGRQISTPAAHLAPVTCLAVDEESNFLLSGADDSNVLVWSLLDLLSFPSMSDESTSTHATPRHTLSTHRSGITTLCTGHGGASAGGDIALSASKDSTVIVWDYVSGVQLRTFLLLSVPLSLVMDAADRAFYAGYGDGSVQLVDLYSLDTLGSINTPSSVPVQPPESSRWAPRSGGVVDSEDSTPAGKSSASVAAQCLTLSHDATTLLSGHANGSIQAWDVATGAFRGTAANYPGTCITNLSFLPVTGWPAASSTNARSRVHKGRTFKAATITKPKPAEFDNGITQKYNINTILLPMSRTPEEEESEIQQALHSTVFDDAMLAESILELSTWDSSAAKTSAAAIQAQVQPDFLPLESAPIITIPKVNTKTHPEARSAHAVVNGTVDISMPDAGDVDEDDNDDTFIQFAEESDHDEDTTTTDRTQLTRLKAMQRASSKQIGILLRQLTAARSEAAYLQTSLFKVCQQHSQDEIESMIDILPAPLSRPDVGPIILETNGANGIPLTDEEKEQSKKWVEKLGRRAVIVKKETEKRKVGVIREMHAFGGQNGGK
jgi:pre-rRNA-processing protein IPI3